VSLLKFENWTKLSESVISFDPDARYPDQTFGYPVGAIDSGGATLGGDDGNWGGCLSRALWFGKVADEWGAAHGKTKSLITSQKRSRVLTASGNTSDHFKGVTNSYAVDISASGTEGDELLAYIMAKFGHPEYKGGSWINFTKNGYRYQIGWKVPDHFDHIHVGVKNTSSSTPKSSNITTTSTSIGKSFAEKVLNNPQCQQWLTTNMPELAETLTADQLNKTFTEKPEHKEWFKTKFGLNDEGDVINKNSSDTETATDAALSSRKIKSNYTGEKAKNIDLLISELEAKGVTNKYAIIGALSTIGKESGFIPQNEISYANTDNSGIRKNFGPRVKDLSDAELTTLKQNPAKFFDKVYGPEAKAKLGWNTGNDNPGDGYKYRGRGFNQITFKYNYQKYSDLTGIDLVANPDQLNTASVAAKAAVAFLLDGLKSKGIDPNSFKNKREAIHAFVQVNAGANKNIEGSSTLAKADTVSNNFTLV